MRLAKGAHMWRDEMNDSKLGLALCALVTGGCSSGLTSGPSEATLAGTDWELVQIEAGGGVVSVPPEQTFTARFGTEAELNATVDCNVCQGSYAAAGTSLSVGPLACTRAYCGDDSLDDRFLSALQGAESYLRSGSELRITHRDGVLRFRQR
jgi:heat shock protein HslJ